MHVPWCLFVLLQCDILSSMVDIVRHQFIIQETRVQVDIKKYFICLFILPSESCLTVQFFVQMLKILIQVCKKSLLCASVKLDYFLGHRVFSK